MHPRLPPVAFSYGSSVVSPSVYVVNPEREGISGPSNCDGMNDLERLNGCTSSISGRKIYTGP
jgi:hypothetical protein